MAGNCKKKSLRSVRNKKRGLGAKKAAATRMHKIVRIKRHLRTHETDKTAIDALKKIT